MNKMVVCPQCRARFSRSVSDDLFSCPACGTQYKMRREPPVLMPPEGRGIADYLTVPNDSVIGNRPLLKSFIPKGWRYQCALVDNRFDLVGNPFVLAVTYCAPDNSARIVFVGESFYRHVDNLPQNAILQYRLDDLTVSRTPSFYRLKSCMRAGEYCDEMAQSYGLRRMSGRGERQPGESEQAQLQRDEQRFISQGFMNVSAEWAGKYYGGVAQNGRRMKIYAETRVVQMMRYTEAPTMQMMPVGGMFGMRMVPQMVTQQRQDYFWDTPYEITLYATEPVFDSAYYKLQQILQSLEYLPGMDQARAAAMQLAGNTVMNIAQAQAGSMERQSKIIADTQQYTSGVQQQMIADNAASHNRTANRYSEMVKGVNTFYDNTGVVEVSTQYDHVYQNTRDSDLYAAQEGDALEFGTDFEELNRTDGDY